MWNNNAPKLLVLATFLCSCTVVLGDAEAPATLQEMIDGIAAKKFDNNVREMRVIAYE